MSNLDGGRVVAGIRDDGGNVTQVVVHVAGYAGQGLALTLDNTQLIPVPADGIWRLKVDVPAPVVDLVVATQPTLPHQHCDVVKIDDTVFTVACHAQDWAVSGVINGLEGKGLRIGLFDDSHDDDALRGLPHALFVASEGGPFRFAKDLEDDVNYHIEILTQPTDPRQDCVVENAEGYADGFDIDNVIVNCSTRTYSFTTVVSGLKGKGLTVTSSTGAFPINPGITNYTEQYPDGYQYDIQVKTQPANPAQVCFLQNNKGKIDGANVTVTVVCDAAGHLRIAEVGACPFSSSSCWFEIINTGTEPEQLAFYKVRTSAISPAAFTPSRVFTLPEITIPQFATVVIQGKTGGAMADGKGVFHIADGNVVPWWSSDGFLELLNPSGATASFIRWGTSTQAPTTGGTYGGGSAPALPRGAGGYGYSIAHPFADGANPPLGTEFKLTAFATFGGTNDTNSEVDADTDGIPDSAEIPGGSFAGLSMYLMGARVGQKDVFVEIDHMSGNDPAVIPRKEALIKVTEAFRKKNVALHFDVGNLYADGFDPASFNLGGGNEVPFATAVSLAPSDPAIKNLYDIKATNMAANRRMIFYYQLFAWSQQKDGSGGSSGVGELPGNDTIITLGGFGLDVKNLAQRNLVANYQASTMMHELGHNFSLRHGGGDALNRKPNYVSVMNYLYSPFGLPTIGSSEGDRYDFYKRCRLSSVTQLLNAPSGDPTRFVIDFSSGNGEAMDENELRETEGLGRMSSQPVDYNCNNRIDTATYSRDLNGDGALDMLIDNDDWSALDFIFRRTSSGAESGPSLFLADGLVHADPLTSDTEHVTDESCPTPYVPDMSEIY